MFNKLSCALCTVLLLISTDSSARSIHRHHAGLSQIVQDTRVPPCATCSACHAVTDHQVCATAKNDKYKTIRGLASYYGGRWHGRRTASGERFNKYALTVAHKTLPFGTKLKITNLANNKSVIVIVNDRGPFIRNRSFDLSQAAAFSIGITGVEPVIAEIVG